MKFANSFILATLIMLICGVAHARGIQYDCGQYDINQAIPASNTYSTDNLTLSFSPGADNAPFNGNTSCSGNEDPNDFMAQGGFYQSGNMLAADWQILVTNTSSAFTVEFLYSSDISTNDPNCAGETATLSLQVPETICSTSPAQVSWWAVVRFQAPPLLHPRLIQALQLAD
jgi:hypothetical protein